MVDAPEGDEAGAAPRGERTRAGVRARRASTTPAMGRAAARRNAMMLLYGLDLLPRDPQAAVEHWAGEHGFPLPAYAERLVIGAWDDRDALDASIQEVLREDWAVARLGAVERAVLRLATWELREATVPVEVAIDEAVELATRYASPEAAKLVNGVLGAWVRRNGTTAVVPDGASSADEPS